MILRTRGQESSIEATRLHRIAAPGAEDISLGILEKRSERADPCNPPILLVPGTTFGANLFDLARPGYSMMAELAHAGRAVYALDIRGYGNSMNGHVMSAPPEEHPPFGGLADAVKDIGAAVAFVLAREPTSVVDLIGFSWGTVTTATFVGKNPKLVGRLAFYGPLYNDFHPGWLDRVADPKDKHRIDPKIGAYRLITQADVTQRWNSEIPDDDPDRFREAGLPELLFETFAAVDPRAHSRKPAAFRSPTGALAHLITSVPGQPLFDARNLTMPTLLIRGANDMTATDADSRRLLSAIASPKKEYCAIAPGSHFLCVERSRQQLYDRLNQFFRTP